MTLNALILPGTLDSLKAIRSYVVEAAEIAGLGRKAAYRLILAVDEIATNIILHGYQEANLDGDIMVQAEINDRTLTIRLEDIGEPYNPSLAEEPENLDKPLDQRTEGGLGVYLAAKNVDRFNYERIGERNLHTFVMELTNELGG